jgi:hypothetical protein
VTEKTGFLIPMGGRDEIIERFRAVLAHLAQHPEEIEARSTAALRRAREVFTWDEKARRTCLVYQWLLNPKAARPEFAMPEPDLE